MLVQCHGKAKGKSSDTEKSTRRGDGRCKCTEAEQFSCWRPHQKSRRLEPSRRLWWGWELCSRSGRALQAPVKVEALGRFGTEETLELITLLKDLSG